MHLDGRNSRVDDVPPEFREKIWEVLSKYTVDRAYLEGNEWKVEDQDHWRGSRCT